MRKVNTVLTELLYFRWNYSVGLHNVTITHNGIPECNSDVDPLKVIIRAVVPKGLLYVVNKEYPEKVEWEYQVGDHKRRPLY